MAYTRTNWVNDSPPRINATNLNKIEVGIEEAHTAIQQIIDGGGGGGGVTHHAALTGRDSTNAHPISAITNLQATLDAKANLEHYHSASAITDGVFAPARLGTGATGEGKRFLREDGTWQEVEGGGGGGVTIIDNEDGSATIVSGGGGGGGDGGPVAWGDVIEKPAFVAAGSTALAARQAIGAGTSSLAIGTTANTAAAGNHTHTEYAAASHTHSEYAATTHSHPIGQVTGLQAELDDRVRTTTPGLTIDAGPTLPAPGQQGRIFIVVDG